MSERFEYTIGDADAGERLDVVVVRALGGRVGRTKVRGWFEHGDVLVSGKVASKGWRARAGDVIAIEVGTLDAAALADEGEALDVVLEREDLVVVSKRAGQPTAPIRAGERGTLVNALLGRYPEMDGVGYGPREPGIVHRLDTDTSGLVLAARTERAFEILSGALRAGDLRKEYLLVCGSTGLADTGVIDIPIGVEGKQSKRVVACVRTEEIRRCNPRPARTTYRVVERRDGWALVLAEAPKAVRHQIRVHFSAIGHPLAGDGLYGGDERVLKRHALHAHSIAWRGGVLESFDVRRDPPDDMLSLMGTGSLQT